jgi:selenocysteine lyase/cysteine desulfurase
VATRALARPVPPAAPPTDDALWREVQDAFELDRSFVNFNNGGVSPCPRSVHDAVRRYDDIANLAPSYTMWSWLEPGIETVRRELAREMAVDPGTVAVTRNASEAMQIVQLGLPLKAGDRVVVTDQDYPRMRDTWEQRVRRDGIEIDVVSLPARAEPDLVLERYASAIGPRTRVLHITHVTHTSGQVMPVQELCALARDKGLFSLVDAAHATFHLPFRVGDLGCDALGTSLHKWLMAPIGTGMLYVRPERIEEIWPMQPAPAALAKDIRKFEEIGTHPASQHNAIAEALAFHRRIGAQRKHARLHALRMRWTRAVREHRRVRLHTVDDPARSGAIGVVEIDGMTPADAVAALWTKWRIFSVAIDMPSHRGVRLTPSVYTTDGDADLLGEALLALAG